MPRGSSREFRTKYSGAAAALGISGGIANRLTDSGFVANARGAFEDQGFSVSGRNVSRQFQDDANLAQAELGLSAFTAQTQSINFPTEGTTDKFLNETEQAIGIANLWSLGVWWKPVVPADSFLCVIGKPALNTSRINLYHDNSSNRLRFDIGDTSGTPVEVTAYNDFYTGENGNWVHVLITWNGTTFFVLKNGVDQGAPDVGVNNPSITMANDTREFSGGNLIAGGSAASIAGNLAQIQLWNADVRAAATFLNTSPSSVNLNADSGAYTFSGNLAHWYRLGHEPAPNLGRDYAEAGFTPTIDLGADLVGIVDGDRQADVP